jgi:N-acetylglucosamine-6-sulfatase
VVVLAVVVGAAGGAFAVREVAERGEALSGKPNLLFILTDDQRWDSMEVMPQTRQIFKVNFPQAVVTTPLCCPSRSTYLTGRYVHNTKVFTNDGYPVFKASEPDSLGPWLKAQGYYTGFVGKYFNRFPRNNPVPPGWDEFYARVWGAQGGHLGGGSARFALREKWLDGSVPRNEVVFYPNEAYPRTYITTVFSDIAVRFIQRAEDPQYNPDRKPWALVLWPNAPNITLAEAKYVRSRVPIWNKPPSVNEQDLSDKPPEVAHGPNRNLNLEFHRMQRSAQLRVLRSVDDMVARLFAELDEHDARSRTWGIFASDNGRIYGEHGLSKKLYAYEEGIRVPFRMFVPGGTQATFNQVVANIDAVPTLMELAGDQSDHEMDGRSLVPLVTGRSTRWRNTVLLENWAHLRYEGVRTTRWKLITWVRSGNVELYDLRNDPFELENVAEERPGIVREMFRRLRRLQSGSS